MENKRIGVRWDLSHAAGDRCPAYKIQVLDIDGKPVVAGYEVTMRVKRFKTDADDDAVLTLTVGKGFTVDKDIVAFDTNVPDVAAKYVHSIRFKHKSKGWLFTQFAGVWLVVRPEAPEDDEPMETMLRITKLPIKWDSLAGEYALAMEGGEGVLATEGNDPQTIALENQ